MTDIGAFEAMEKLNVIITNPRSEELLSIRSKLRGALLRGEVRSVLLVLFSHAEIKAIARSPVLQRRVFAALNALADEGGNR